MVATPIKTFFLVTNQAYFNGDETTIYCVKVKEKTMIKETVMIVDTNCFPKAIKGGHFFAEGLWKYRSIKQAAYIGSWTKALSKSAIVKPMRRYVVGHHGNKRNNGDEDGWTKRYREESGVRVCLLTVMNPDCNESRHRELLLDELSFTYGKELLPSDQELLRHVKFIWRNINFAAGPKSILLYKIKSSSVRYLCTGSS